MKHWKKYNICFSETQYSLTIMKFSAHRNHNFKNCTILNWHYWWHKQAWNFNTVLNTVSNKMATNRWTLGSPRSWVDYLITLPLKQDLVRSNTENDSTSPSIYGGLTLRVTEINTVAAGNACSKGEQAWMLYEGTQLPVQSANEKLLGRKKSRNPLTEHRVSWCHCKFYSWSSVSNRP
jgi:hypothetical protein